MFIKPEHMSYPACPKDGCGKKLIEKGDMDWMCERCREHFPAPEYRYTLSFTASDHTGQLWLQAYNEVGPKILNYSAQDLLQLRESDPDEFMKVVKNATFQTFFFRCRAKQETYQETTKVRYSVMDLIPLKPATFSKALLARINS